MRLSPIALVAVFAIGCGAGEADLIVRTDSAGVGSVLLLRTPPVLAAAVDTIVVLGGEPDGALGFFRMRRALVDVDPAGMIYVLDQSQHQVVAFSDAGDVVRVYGREGEGPGELSHPISVSVSEAGSVVVHDAGRGRIVTFDSDGSLLTEATGPQTVISTALRHVEVTPSGLALWMRDPFQGTDLREERLILLAGADTAPMVAGQGSQSSTAHHPRCATTFTAPIPLAARIRWAQSGDRVVVAHRAGFGFTVYEGGQARLVVDRPEDGEEIDRAEAVERLASAGWLGPCQSDAREYVEKHGFNPRPQTITSVSLRPDGGIWATRTSDANETWLFDQRGEPLGVALLPAALGHLPDGRVLIAVTDSFDVERLGIVRVTFAGGAF